MKALHACAAAALLLACAAAPAQQGPKLGKVLQESVAPNPAKPGGEGVHTFKPLPKGAWRFEQGEYRSGASGLSIRLPQLRDEKVVSVREAVVIRRSDGDAATTHVMFVPGTEGTAVERQGPVSAVVVTRLQGDRPHDRESVLKAWEPGTPEQRKKMEARGIEFHRIATRLGEGLERIVPNRFVDANFPYRTHIDETATKILSVGVTRYLVSRDEALLEFSQVFPCRELAPEACKAAALRASDRFVQGVGSFVLLKPGAQAPAKAASQPQNKSSSQPQGK